MPFQPIPLQVSQLGVAGAPPAPAAGVSVFGTWAAIPVIPPQPVERFDLGAVHLPLWIEAEFSGTAPTVCHLSAQLFLSGTPVIGQAMDIPLVALSGSPGWVGGGGSFDQAPPTPIAYRAGQTLQAGYIVSFDEATTLVNVGMGGTITSPAGAVTTTPGSIGYVSYIEAAVPIA